jgi:predicted metal-binding membrane protein
VTAVPGAGRPRLGRLQRTAWRHPEWTVALVALACWASLAALHAHGWGLPDGHGSGAAHSATDHTAMHHAATRSSAEHTGSWLAAQGNWLLMAPAMMLPSALPAARHVALNSRWRRRQRGSAVFVATYLAIWLLFGLVVVSIAGWAHVPTGANWPLVLALVVAAGWELTAVKRRCLRACHRTVPLPPNGWKADAACARFGLRYGWSCFGACWALMLPMAIAGHASLLMVVLTAIVVAEEGLVKGTRLGRAAALVLVAAAAMVAIAA